ncbi:MAG TPA: thioredoxin family protein [Ignavibacteriales bacterium]|nr:thioredoxin family protein [Ignavibacteriales bacterium]
MRKFIALLIFILALSVSVSAQDKKNNAPKEAKPKITFVELGSVNCIPCKKMQPVMKAVEKKYGPQIKVIFYDVWQKDQSKYADEYKIRLIPTQVFLDENGKEIGRHEGFYAEEDMDKFLQSKGLKVLTSSK